RRPTAPRGDGKALPAARAEGSDGDAAHHPDPGAEEEVEGRAAGRIDDGGRAGFSRAGDSTGGQGNLAARFPFGLYHVGSASRRCVMRRPLSCLIALVLLSFTARVPATADEPLHIIAFGAHPDDCDIR